MLLFVSETIVNAVFCAALVISVLHVSHSKPLAYQLRAEPKAETSNTFKEALLEEIAKELSKEENSQQADQQSSLDNLIYGAQPGSKYANDLMSAHHNPRPKTHSASNWINHEDDYLTPGNSQMSLNEEIYDSVLGKNRYPPSMRDQAQDIFMKDDPVQAYETQNGPIGKQRLSLTDKQLQLLGLDIENNGMLMQNLQRLDGNSLNRIGKARKGKIHQVRHSRKGSKKIKHKSRANSANIQGLIEGLESEENLKSGRPIASGKVVESTGTGKQSPVDLLIKEIESIVLPNTHKSTNSKQQESREYTSDSFDGPSQELRGEPNSWKGLNGKYTSQSSVLPLDEPLQHEISSLLTELNGVHPRRRASARQVLALPLDEPNNREQGKTGQELDASLTSEDIEYLAKLLRQKQELKDGFEYGPRGVPQGSFTETLSHQGNYISGNDKVSTEERNYGFANKDRDGLNKEMEKAWMLLEQEEEREKEEEEKGQSSSANGELLGNADKKKPNNKLKTTVNEKETNMGKASNHFYPTGLKNSVTSEVQGPSSKAESTGEFTGKAGEGSKQPATDNKDIISQIEARVAELENLWANKNTQATGIKAKFRM